MKYTLSAWLALLGACFFVGCAQTHYFRVDALADAALAENKGSFRLENGFPDAPGSSLRYREAADYVSRALTARGYTPAASEIEADLIVTVSATVSDPLTETERSMEPIYYRTWGHSGIIRTPVVDNTGAVRYVNTRVYSPPETHFAGYSSRDRSVVVYQKQLELTARTPDGAEAWTVQVSTTDSDSDLRASIPYLAAAAAPYLGRGTEGVVAVRLREDDEMVQYLRGMGTAEPQS